MSETRNSAIRVIDKSAEALRLKFPISCATCEHLHKAWETNAADCGRVETCGGPISGRAFPDYKGPINRKAFPYLCLICGSSDVRLHVAVGHDRFGLCYRHRKVFDRSHGPGKTLPVVVPAGPILP